MRFVYNILLIALVSCLAVPAHTQRPDNPNSESVHNAIKKLGVLGSVLYVAAHPDDENTRLISYYANEVKAHTTYLSMTRGDGGQNLIGPEMRELLGIIRTNELMMARSIDGGNQMFTRANDFGYSKTPEETLDFWQKEEILGDVVWAIRKNRPDIIVTRFPHEHLDGNHGHHTTSALLAYEAFDIAADPDVYPEQLQYVDPWQPRRMFFNTHWWFYGSEQAFDTLDKSTMAQVEIGVYFPMKGMSNPEIAAASRSMHKSQGFGASSSRESITEYLSLTLGDMPSDPADVFSDIDITWSRIGAPVGIPALIEKIDNDFDHEHPYASIKDLVELHKMISALPGSFWKSLKLEELELVIVDCAGLFLEAVAHHEQASPGGSISIRSEVTNRSPVAINLVDAQFNGQALMEAEVACEMNAPVLAEKSVTIPGDAIYTSPYWLEEPGTEGMYKVDDQQMRGLPVNQRTVGVDYVIEIEGLTLGVFRALVYKETDPVEGEVYKPFEIVPPVFVNIDNGVYVFGDTQSRNISVRVKTAVHNVNGTLYMEAPDGWSINPGAYDVSIATSGDEETFTFELTPPVNAEIGSLKARVDFNGRTYDLGLTEIDYDHIPHQTVLQTAQTRVVKLDLEKAGDRIGYIMGAGDEIPASLEQVGYSVDILDEALITPEIIKQYDAIILGVRLYNTSERIQFYQEDLFNYVGNGGTLIVQYNTSRGLNAEKLTPIPLILSRDRITDENSPVVFLNDHAVLNSPNTITQGDFEGWVQERGLYFPGEWDDGFTPVLGMNDPGEEQVNGALLVGAFGDGYVVYTGLSFFRQLPAGVPGAYRLLVNLISVGKPSKS